MNCKNCNTEINSKFCPDCGQPASLKRIDGKYIIHEIEHVLHFERGILYTIRELITNPGQNIRNYLSENRSRLVKPIIFIIITSLIYSLTVSIFHIEDGYVKFEGDATKYTTQLKITKWIQSHYGYANLIMGVFTAFWIKLFFKKHKLNLFEIIIMLCFVMGMGMLIFSVFALLQGLTNLNLMSIGGMVGIAYCTWAIGHFYGKTQIINYVKAFFAYILGMITFILLATILGITIDLILKH
jgi:hypothetical protein